MNERNIVMPDAESGWSPIGASRVAATFTHPDDVVNDPHLTHAEKKAVLAAWSSDARAVENAPTLRRLDSGALVEVEAILRALRSLDAPAAGAKRLTKWLRSAPHRPGVISSLLRRGGSPTRESDDDDDPPPAPASVAVPYRHSFVAHHAPRPTVFRAAARAAG